MAPPAPRPQSARAKMKLVMLCASAHHTVAMMKMVRVNKYRGFLPMASDNRPKIGWKLVAVRRNAVDNHDALLDEWKYEVMTGWLDTIMVPSNEDKVYMIRMPPKISQNCRTLTPPRYGDFEDDDDSSSSLIVSWILLANNFLRVLSGLDVRESLLTWWIRELRNMGVSCDSASIPSPPVKDVALDSMRSNSLSSTSTSVSVASSPSSASVLSIVSVPTLRSVSSGVCSLATVPISEVLLAAPL